MDNLLYNALGDLSQQQRVYEITICAAFFPAGLVEQLSHPKKGVGQGRILGKGQGDSGMVN